MNFKNILRRSLLSALAPLSLWCGIAAAEEGARYEVTVTNLTRGQRFTPVLVATHKDGFNLFHLGQPASSQLKTLAEEGNTGPMVALLSSMPDVVGEVVSSPPRRRSIGLPDRGNPLHSWYAEAGVLTG